MKMPLGAWHLSREHASASGLQRGSPHFLNPMSAAATFWAWDQRVNDPNAKLVLLCLADMANDKHEAWPKRATISAKTTLSKRSITRAIRHLTRYRFVVSEVRTREENPGRTSNMYTLLVGTFPKPPPIIEKKVKKKLKLKRKTPWPSCPVPPSQVGDTPVAKLAIQEPTNKDPNDVDPRRAIKKEQLKITVELKQTEQPKAFTEELLPVLERDSQQPLYEYGTRTAYWPD